jgi:hypothetical protein
LATSQSHPMLVCCRFSLKSQKFSILTFSWRKSVKKWNGSHDFVENSLKSCWFFEPEIFQTKMADEIISDDYLDQVRTIRWILPLHFFTFLRSSKLLM